MTATVTYYTKGYNGGELIGVIIAVTIVTGLLVIWRIAFRAARRALNLSDAFIVMALCLALAQAVFNALATTQWGYGYHKADLPPKIAKSTTPTILFWLNQWFFKLETGLTKLSIIIIYAGIFDNADTTTVNVSRILNYILGSCVAVYYVAGTLVSIFQCTPIQREWDKTISGTCIDNTMFRLANAYINVLTSAWIIILPLPTLFQLKSHANEVAQLIGLILLGTIHTGCAIARLVLMYYPAKDSSTDPQWSSTLSNTLAMVEEFVGIIAATLMVMRACFHTLAKRLRGDTSLTTKGSTKKSKLSGYALDPIHTQRQGFNRIQRTTEIELQSRSVSTEEILNQKSQYSE